MGTAWAGHIDIWVPVHLKRRPLEDLYIYWGDVVTYCTI
jgi:hypothetical protein